MTNRRVPLLLIAVLALASVLALAACIDDTETTLTVSPSPTSEPTVSTAPTSTLTQTATPLQPTPAVLGNCRDGMRLQPGEGCRYTGGGTPPASVVLSVAHDGAICREGGPAKQEFGGITINMDSLRICFSGGFERDDAFQSEIVANANADGSWTFYESSLSASGATAHTPVPTATPIPNSQGDSHCSAGMVRREGDHCTVSIPGVNVGTDRFEIREGSGCYGNICSATGLRLNDFIATKNPDGSWTIERVPATTTRPSATPTLMAISTPTPTPVGPAVEVANLECSGERISLGNISYEVTGEIHANRDLEDVQVGFGETASQKLGSGGCIFGILEHQ